MANSMDCAGVKLVISDRKDSPAKCGSAKKGKVQSRRKEFWYAGVTNYDHNLPPNLL